MYYPIIEKIFNTQAVIDAKGEKHPLSANISFQEGKFLFDLINDNDHIQKTMEIGCAFGISSLFICNALENKVNKEHTIIDPFQSIKYKKIGVNNLEEAGVDFFILIEEGSELALPKISISQPNSFDLIFIDGVHTFDHALLDFYYANMLIREGGLIVFDDCSYPSIAKVLSYILKYPAYKVYGQLIETNIFKKTIRRITNIFSDSFYTSILPAGLKNLTERARYPSMIALQKIGPDARNYKWYKHF